MAHRLTRAGEGGMSSAASNAYQRHRLWSQKRHWEHRSSLRMSRKALKVVGANAQHFSLHQIFPYDRSACASSLLGRSFEDTDHFRSEYYGHYSWFDYISLLIALYPHFPLLSRIIIHFDNVCSRSSHIRTKSFSSADTLELYEFAFTELRAREVIREKGFENKINMA